MTLRLRVDGLDVAIRDVRALPPELARRVIERMSQIAYDSTERGADRHTKKGALRQSVFNRSITLGREVGHDTRRAPYAPFVIFGTRPHKIRPKNRQALRFTIGNRIIFAKSVDHPGYVGDDYLTRAADDAIRQFAAVVDAAFKEA